MRSTTRYLILCSAVLALGAPHATIAGDEGAKIVEEVCSSCHTEKLRPLDKMHLTRAEWADAVERMNGYGAEVQKKKLPELLDYLARTYGTAGASSAAPAGADKK